MIFSDPLETLTARETAQVVPVLQEAAARVARDGCHVAGFLCYEAASAFDEAFVTPPAGKLPLACFGVFGDPEYTDELPPAAGTDAVPHWQIAIERDAYRSNIAAIRRQIARGNTYQVNYCVRQYSQGICDPWRLFRDIAADAPFAAFVDASEYAIVSASPELFFDLRDRRLTCRPMKGTAARGMTTDEDRRIRDALAKSIKNRAENVMIADMVRNDLGRIARPGGVEATSLFDLEKYRTVWQMTSTITAETEASIPDIFRALFPSASVTGAPKVASMRLIAELEPDPRQVYTGCIGFIAPQRQARFNVAIRTAIVDRRDGSAVYGVGGGIVWDSDADEEYQECLDKAGILAANLEDSPFRLLETLLWTPGGEGWCLLDRHLSRLADSAAYFDFACDRARIEQQLRRSADKFEPSPQRVRMLLDRNGELAIEARVMPGSPSRSPLRLQVAREPIDRRNPFMYHKTTARGVYEDALKAAGRCDDVLLWNERREITESSVANVVLRIDGTLCTPPVACGLLPGTLRGSLLDDGTLVERIVRLDDLAVADGIYLINSVRGWRPAVINEKATATRSPRR